MPNVLATALAHIGQPATEVFLQHLRGGTSADYLSDWLKRCGAPVSATTLKKYRRSLT